MLAAGEFGTGQVFWSLLWFFLFFIWIWLLITVFADIFRSSDLSGWGKALWTIFVIFVPYLGVFVYLIARGRKMNEHAEGRPPAGRGDAGLRQGVAGTSASPAEEVARLADLRDKGVIDEAEFQRAEGQGAELTNWGSVLTDALRPKRFCDGDHMMSISGGR